jgi:hypothetical protein
MEQGGTIMALTKKAEFRLARQERLDLVDLFKEFLDKVERQGADYAELQALLTILSSIKPKAGADALPETLTTHIDYLASTIIPDPLTLSEAASIYGIKASTLRRACWSGRLSGVKRGKTWFVRVSDLEGFAG